jgi:enoyl-CoA hydratase / 3-hydroxyacyl-CoA dehydrogenase
MMNINDVKKIAVIGSGAMGHGIAQVCAVAGYDVVMVDIKQEFINNGMAKIKESLEFLVGKGKMTQDAMNEILNKRITTSTSNKEAVASVQVVIEAVPEIMDLKKSVFKEISEAAQANAILATNTSTMSISEIATVVKNPERFVGLHFFNPVTRMKLVEVIYGQKTKDDAVNLMCEITTKIDKIPVKVLKDRPGFIVNRISAPNQALISAILDEGKIKPNEIDAVMKKMGVKMAPFEVADFVGLDVFCHTLEYYEKTLSPQYKPGKFLHDKIAKKELGMKSGQGIYKWDNGKAIIDTSKETTEISPIHFLSIQINEAVKVFKEGIAANRKDIDDGVKYGMNAFAGPFTLASGMQPQQITDALNFLYQRYKLDMFKPEPEITDGSFKTLGA